MNPHDCTVLRRLAARIAEIAHSDLMTQRRQDWRALNSLHPRQPLIIVEHSGVLNELTDFFKPECEADWARNIELNLRQKLFEFDYVGDDIVIEPVLNLSPAVTNTGYGVTATRHGAAGGPAHGSFAWDAALPNFPEGLEQLRSRQFSFDTVAWEREQANAAAVLGDLLRVQCRPWLWWSLGLTSVATEMVGLEGFMLALYDHPQAVHQLMAFLRDDCLQALEWHEQAGLLYPNNRDEYFGSGGCGYTDDLTATGPGTTRQLWALSESQETVSVAPAMFEEFVFPYQLPVLERFGLSYYGCCEPVDNRWHIIKRIPNLRAVSISPWANVEKMAENLGRHYVFCRKPNPAYVSTRWDENLIRTDLRHTIEATKGLSVQLVLKDVHTISTEPWRLRRWVAIAREEIRRIYGA